MTLTRLDKGCLEHIGKQRQNGIERRKFFIAPGDITILDTTQKLGQDSKIQDQRGGQERVLKGFN